MLIKLNWITLRVRNLEASIHFYHNLLGLTVQRRFESRGRQIAMLGLGETSETSLELIEGSEQVLKPDAGISIGYEVTSLDETMKHLENMHIPILRGPVEPNPRLRFIYIADPDGFEVQLAEHLK
ncbi:lactoylglutathione lyase [Paenibacillus polysaccharolyticus]|uniref:Lactoylglutathione lyase n=1 Tax=Paenibacillus polysaccharolyticus TaxID=582692 RepID=A0A1G5B763_9BACL|nr:VOC family protein [Paenibacillus polysaccharolyticus]SCX85850.1 lactoylglutathione lyase [Paenibacillus polysaccharolyticus]